MLFFSLCASEIEDGKFKPIGIIYEEYCHSLAVQEPVMGWTLTGSSSFAGWISDPQNRKDLYSDFMFFVENIIPELVGGKYRCTLTMPEMNDCQIVLEHEATDEFRQAVEASTPESAEDYQHRQARWIKGEEYWGKVKNASIPCESIYYATVADQQGHARAKVFITCFANISDPAIVFKLLEEAAQLGDPQAQIKLANAYVQGLGVEANTPKAFKWAKKNADRGGVQGQHWVGHMYMNGIGTFQSIEKALDYLEMAELQDYEPAKSAIGLLYAQGETVKDILKAREYLKLIQDSDDLNALVQNKLKWVKDHLETLDREALQIAVD